MDHAMKLSMPIGEAMFTQRSIRRFKPDPIPMEHILLIMQRIGVIVRINLTLLDLLIEISQLFGETVDTGHRIAKRPIALLTHVLEAIR